MVKKKGSREMNPADAFRKTQRAKEIARNKKERRFQRDAHALQANPDAIKNELKEVLALEDDGKLNLTVRLKKRALQSAYDTAIKKKKEEELRAKQPAVGEYSFTSQHGHGVLERRPEDSVYYHPTINPQAIPPVGKPQRYKTSAVQQVAPESLPVPKAPPLPREPPPSHLMLPPPPGPPPGSSGASTSAQANILPPPEGPPPAHMLRAHADSANMMPQPIKYAPPMHHSGPVLPPPSGPPPGHILPPPAGPPPGPRGEARSMIQAASTVAPRPRAQDDRRLTSMVPASVRVRRDSAAAKQAHAVPLPPVNAAPTVGPGFGLIPAPAPVTVRHPPKPAPPRTGGSAIDRKYQDFVAEMAGLGAL